MLENRVAAIQICLVYTICFLEVKAGAVGEMGVWLPSMPSAKNNVV